PEPLGPMRAGNGDTHLDRQRGRDDRQQESKREGDAASELGEGRDPCPKDGRPQSHARDPLRPSREAGPAPHTEDFLRSMSRDDETDHHTNERQREVGADDRCDGHGIPPAAGRRTTPSERSFWGAYSATRSYRADVRVDHVVIAVSDFERSNAFYREVFGAEIVEIDGRVAYRMDGQQLNVHGPGTVPAMVARIPVVPGNSDICFEWNGTIDEALEHLRACRVQVEAGPMTRGGAKGRGTSVYFRDPDGTLLELISYA